MSITNNILYLFKKNYYYIDILFIITYFQIKYLPFFEKR